MYYHSQHDTVHDVVCSTCIVNINIYVRSEREGGREREERERGGEREREREREKQREKERYCILHVYNIISIIWYRLITTLTIFSTDCLFKPNVKRSSHFFNKK